MVTETLICARAAAGITRSPNPINRERMEWLTLLRILNPPAPIFLGRRDFLGCIRRCEERGAQLPVERPSNLNWCKAGPKTYSAFGNVPSRSSGLRPRDLSPSLARFGESDGNGLFPVFYSAASTALAGVQLALVGSPHSAFHALACRLAILCHRLPPRPGLGRSRAPAIVSRCRNRRYTRK